MANYDITKISYGGNSYTVKDASKIATDAKLFTTNSFADNVNRALYISKIDNSLYCADKRFAASATVDGQAVSNVSTLFNGSYEDGINIPDGKSGKITIDFSNSPGSKFPGYPYGEIYLSFYSARPPQSITGRIYNNYAGQTVGWKDLSFSAFGATGLMFVAPMNFYGLQTLEITINAPNPSTYGEARIVQLEFHLTRPDPKYSPIVSKYAAETLYYPLTAPSFVGNLTGNVSGKVNNHTVNSDVPANAVFTDTTYESKPAASGGTAVSLVTTGEKYTWNSKTSNTGTVTKVSTGAGLTGGDITTTGTVKANLTSETKLTNAAADGTETANRVYPVRLDSNGKLAVNVPWVDTWRPAYSLPLAANGTRGGVQVGYTQSGKNYPVQLSSEKMYVNVPWENTWRGVQDNLNSTATDQSLSANQGKVLNDNKVNKTIKLADGTDLNTVVTSGFYRLLGNLQHAPSIDCSYSQMIVSRGGDTILQIIGKFGDNRLVTRTGYRIGQSNPVWTDWQELALNSSLSNKLDKATDGGLGACNGSGQYSYFKLATITVKEAYANYPLVFEVSRRDYGYQRIIVQFSNSSNADPPLRYFCTDGKSKGFWLYRSAASTWQLYGQYSEALGNCTVHRITGSAYTFRLNVALNLENVSSVPSGATEIGLYWEADVANTARTANTANETKQIIFVKTDRITIPDGTAASPVTVDVDISSSIPSGYSLWDANAQISNANVIYHLPWIDSQSSIHTRILKVQNGKITLQNSAAGWGTIDCLYITAFLKKN